MFCMDARCNASVLQLNWYNGCRRTWGAPRCTRVHSVSLGITLFHLASLGFTLCHSGSLGITQLHLASVGFTWFHLASLGFTWHHSVSLGVTRVHFFTPFHRTQVLGGAWVCSHMTWVHSGMVCLAGRTEYFFSLPRNKKSTWLYLDTLFCHKNRFSRELLCSNSTSRP
jgi:hypothetical protein